MDEIKRIPDIEFEQVLALHKFDQSKLTKDYFLTLLLWVIKDVEGIYFKGGTALNKIFLNHARLSEDLDFTLARNILAARKEIVEKIMDSKLFEGTTDGKNVEGFIRIVVHYRGFANEKDSVFIDLNQREKLFLPSEVHKIKHFYFPFIPEFSIKTIAKEELVAEKLRAAITRNKPRDHFDVYQVIHANMPVNIELAEKKCKEAGVEFSVIKMFNKAKVLKNRWDKDMAALIAEPISFREVIQFLAKHFKLKEEKEKESLKAVF